MNYLWDTNIVIYYLQQQFPPQAEAYIDHLLTQGGPIISVISEIELLCWKTASAQDLNVLQSFISNAKVIELEDAIKQKTADIRKTQAIKLPDAVIAATALVHGLSLLTRNTKDFSAISGLNLVNPFVPPAI